MLRRVENVQVFFAKKMFSSKGRVHVRVGSKQHQLLALWEQEFFNRVLADSAHYPVCFLSIGERNYWLFQNRWHWENENLTPDQVYALLAARDQRRQTSIQRAQSLVAIQGDPSPRKGGRTAIPDEVKQLVWARDGGSCRVCGSGNELQFDHIIPHSMGGSDSEYNLQILCGPCNRRKGASVV
ncbi:HNH endonuclease [Rhodococcus erythropolis]|nr:HNH endonuclease [Rhodococcus erythropolis]